MQSANRSSMADAIKSFFSSISSRFNGTSSSSISSSFPDDHPIQSKPDFRLTDEIVESEQLLGDLFERWLSYHGLETQYRHDKAERFELFKQRARSYHHKNKLNTGCTYGLDFMSAMTRQEIERNFLGLQMPAKLPPWMLQGDREDSQLPWKKMYQNV